MSERSSLWQITNRPQKPIPAAPDCVTKIRMGNSVLVVSGYFKQDSTETAIDKMEKVLQAEAAATQKPTYPA